MVCHQLAPWTRLHSSMSRAICAKAADVTRTATGVPSAT